MTRSLLISNGKFLINFDDDYSVRDIYYPQVGCRNHSTGAAFRIGVRIGKQFRWIDKQWNLRMNYCNDSLITNVTANHDEMQIAVKFEDMIDHELDVFLKKMAIRNLSENKRTVKLLFYQKILINRNSESETIYFDKDTRSLIYFKRNIYFLINCRVGPKIGIPHYAIHTTALPAAKADRDSNLEKILPGKTKNGVPGDSIIGIELPLESRSEETIYYWLCAGKDSRTVNDLLGRVSERRPEYYFIRTKKYWRFSVNRMNYDFPEIEQKWLQVFKASLLVLRGQSDHGGAIISAADSDQTVLKQEPYTFCRPGQASFAAVSLLETGNLNPVRNFFQFCARFISDKGYMHQDYSSDGTLGVFITPPEKDAPTSLPIQEDDTALVLWAMLRYYNRYRDVEFIYSLYHSLIVPAADFLTGYRHRKTGLPQPSLDFWREKYGVHTFTTATVFGGLRAAEYFAKAFGDRKRARDYQQAADSLKEGIVKYLYSSREDCFARCGHYDDGSYVLDMTPDSNLFGLFYFGILSPNNPLVENTAKTVLRELRVTTRIGGIARFKNDDFCSVSNEKMKIPGNPWIVCSLWAALWLTAKAKTGEELKEVHKILTWTADRALESGFLPEQIHPYTGASLSVAPSTITHAFFILNTLEYFHKKLYLTAGREYARQSQTLNGLFMETFN